MVLKGIILAKNIINNSKKSWCKMDVSNTPSLDLACPQAKTEIEKHVHMLRERGVDKKTDIAASCSLLWQQQT